MTSSAVSLVRRWRRALSAGPMDISDAWKNSYSENTSQKIWAAKYTARHPNLVALELSSFKCGHDAPIYTAVEETVTKSGTPYFSFKDIDENKPTGSIKIRVETISYFLKRYREDMISRKQKEAEIEAQLKELERRLRAGEEPITRGGETSVPAIAAFPILSKTASALDDASEELAA